MLRNIVSTLFTKSFVAIVNLAILLVSSKQLGVAVRGEVSLLILNIAIIQAINEIYTGYALVHFIPKFSLSKVYQNGLLFSFVCIAISYFIQSLFSRNVEGQLIHITILSLIIIAHSFHGVIILAKEKIKLYHRKSLIKKVKYYGSFPVFRTLIIVLVLYIIYKFKKNNKTTL